MSFPVTLYQISAGDDPAVPSTGITVTVYSGVPGKDGTDGVGVPAGGTTGQALVKASNADFDTGWATVSGGGGGGSGTVTSVALSAPALFAVAGSPVSTAGMLALTFAAQAPNTFLAGPISGANAAPTMRAITVADLPAGVSLLGAASQTFTGRQVISAAPNDPDPPLTLTPLAGSDSAMIGVGDSGNGYSFVVNKDGSVLCASILGDGAQLTNLDAASLASGTVPDARLSANVPLLVGGKLPTSTLPALAISEFLGVVANQAAMLALVGQRGDWCQRTDDGHNYILIADDPTQAANWKSLSYPAAPVSSVNGQVGVVVLGPADVGAQPASTTLTTLAGLTVTTAGANMLTAASVAAQRTLLGLGALAFLSTLDLATQAAGTLPAGNLPTSVVKDGDTKFPRAERLFLGADGSAITVGTGKTGLVLVMPFPGKITSVRLDVASADGPTGADLILDVNINGTSIWNTTQANRAKIAAGATTGSQAAFDSPNYAAGDVISFDVDQVGSTRAGTRVAVLVKVLEANQ